jgi:hypothetical protein
MGSTNTHLWVQVAKVVPIIGDSLAGCKQNLLDKQAVPTSVNVGIAFARGTHCCATTSLGAGGVPTILPDTSINATGQSWTLRLKFQRCGTLMI